MEIKEPEMKWDEIEKAIFTALKGARFFIFSHYFNLHTFGNAMLLFVTPNAIVTEVNFSNF